MADTLVVEGRNGQVEFDGRAVTIRREGFIGRATQARNEKMIPLSQITAVQFKPYSIFGWGFIAFTLPGTAEAHSRLGSNAKDAAGDENAVPSRRASSHKWRGYGTR
ncbi:MAG: DUF4429 domain-containing protein [Pseudonocardiales bacterium]|nr:DUF4429 domain-containing protein [Pseudonocardiales bacterium]